MARYIDADALLQKYYDTFVDDINIERNIYWDSVTVRKIVNDMPTVDVVEVVHGKWIDKGEDYMIRWTCSNCGRRDTHIYNFCPDCGAKMDLR